MLKKVARKVSRKSSRKAASPAAAFSLEGLEKRQLMAASYPLAININVDTDISKTSPVLKDLGIKAVRLWTTTSWGGSVSQSKLDLVADYKQAGYNTMLIVNIPEVPSYAEAKAFFERVAKQPNALSGVDRWQIGNEPDHKSYWEGSLTQYVQRPLKAAHDVLGTKGEEIVSAGPSWNPDDVIEMVDAGMLDYVDYVGYHPYAGAVGTIKARTEKLKAAIGNKPLVATEWSARGQSDPSSWAALNKTIYPYLRDNYNTAYYFAFAYQDSMAGRSGLVERSSLAPRAHYYDMFKTWKGSGGGTSGGGTSGGGTTTPTTPTIGKVTTIALQDAADDENLAGYTELTDGETIDLSDLSANKLNFLANTSGTVGSVKFTLTGTSTFTDNTSTYTLSDWTPKPGTYTLTVTPYLTDDGGGTKGTVKTIDFTIKASPVVTPPTNPGGGVNPSNGGTPAAGPAITTLKLIDAATGDVIQTLKSGSTIKLSSLKNRNVNIIATAANGANSIKFSFNGKTTIENTATYSVFGNSGDDFNAWYAKAGTYTLSAQAFTKDGAKGTAGAKTSFNVKFV